MIELNWEALASAIGGSSLVGILVRAFITRSLNELEEAVEKIVELKTELARMSVRLENFEKSHDMLTRIDRKVAALEMRVYGSSHKTFQNGSDIL